MGHPRFDIPIIVLAAGGSARMRGRDKLLEDVKGEPLLCRQARMARNVTNGPVIIALPPHPHPRYAALANLDVTLLPVANARDGMNVSLRDSFAALPKGTAACMVLLADMPDLTAADLKTVLQAVDVAGSNQIWRGVTADGKPGHPIAFASSLFPKISQLDGDGGARPVVEAAKGKTALIPLPGNRARLDLDTPEDWAAWRARQS